MNEQTSRSTYRMQLTRHRGTNAKKNERSFCNPVLLQHLYALVAGADCKGSGAKIKSPCSYWGKIKLAIDVSSLSFIRAHALGAIGKRDKGSIVEVYCIEVETCVAVAGIDRELGRAFLALLFVCFAERRRGARPNLGKLVKLDGEICRGGQSSATFCHESWQSSNIFVRIS